MANTGARIRIIVRPIQQVLISSNLIPTTGSIGAAATALSADVATTASFAFTASFVAGNVLSASFAETASFLTGKAESASFADSASFAVTASNTEFASTASFLTGVIESASFALTASFLLGSIQSASVAVTAETASLVLGVNVDGAVALATSASGVAYDDVTAKPTLVSESVQIDHDATTNFESDEHFVQSAIVEVGTVVTGDVSAILPGGSVSSSAQINTGSFTGSFTGEFDGDGEGITGVPSASHAINSDFSKLADVATVAVTAVSASHAVSADTAITAISSSHALQADNALASNTAVSSSHALQADVADLANNATAAVSASHALNADAAISSSHALNADASLLAVSAVTSLTASFVEGSNVNGPVAELDGQGTGSFTGSFDGGINLTDNSDQSSSQFTHERVPLSAKSADFTISFNDGQTQAFAISASLQFEIEDMRPGGFYIVELENQANHLITLPTAAPLVFHESAPVTASAATGALDVYGFYHRGPNTLMTIIGQDIG